MSAAFIPSPTTGDAAAAPAPDSGSCLADQAGDCVDADVAHSLRIGAVFIILACSTVGVCLPYVLGKFKWVGRETNIFLILKAFGAGVILATGLIHMFPDASGNFENPCLGWPDYPWASLFALVTIVVVLLLEHLVSIAYEKRMTKQLARPHSPEEGCANGACVPELDEKMVAQEDARIRSFAIAQVLETGIALHSVLIGIALGVSNSPCTIRPLLAAITFHQFFEGIALGSCLLQADFRSWAFALMAFLFAITTPIGVAIGIGIQSTYNANSLANLVVSGVFDSVSTGILIYMALVDLIAVDFTTKRFRNSLVLQVGSYLSLTAGCAVMAIIGIWA
ncbi:Zinc transporter 5 [Coccomyxa sp. Obi]|nr:Zinc transporter 5 [Coccomyxa sp. Obi]